jgi:hypothetical protein
MMFQRNLIITEILLTTYRLLIFDGSSWHRQQKFTKEDFKSGEDRLMLIAFFHEVTKQEGTGRVLFPITEMKRF